MSENMWKKMKLLGALATATGEVINLACTSDLTFASTIFLSIKWHFTFTCRYSTYYGLIVKCNVTVESHFVLENNLSAFWELTEW